jgi:hypothetical protein
MALLLPNDIFVSAHQLERSLTPNEASAFQIPEKTNHYFIKLKQVFCFSKIRFTHPPSYVQEYEEGSLLQISRPKCCMNL